LGAEVTLAACDAADRTALAALLDAVPPAHPLTAVVHTAGVLDDGLLTAQDPQRLAAVLRPKADAVHALHDLTAHLPLDAFVLFSSAAGLLGSAGQSTYAAANAHLDAFAAWRHARGLPAVSLAWGPWAGDGMAGALDGTDAARLRRTGLAALPQTEALDLFDAARATGRPVLLPLRLDRTAAREAGDALPPVLGSLLGPDERPAAAPRPDAPGPRRETLADRITGLSRAERPVLLLDLVRTEVARVLGFAGPSDVGADRSFREAGFDSLTAVELRNRLSAETGLRLTPTLVFDHPTPRALVEHLDAELPGAEASVLALIGQLGAATARADLDRDARRTVADHLTALLAELGTTVTATETATATTAPATAGAPADPDRGKVTELLHSASDDELFQLLDSGFRSI
ncbi:KR domain-containing protein, partial [Streptomyces sp. NPDC004667]|uniref:KR domain-containing protein n=1 Tax=Streptomyces sp. NPDC004667 TaxID=3154285 RepID=UPI0033A8E15F